MQIYLIWQFIHFAQKEKWTYTTQQVGEQVLVEIYILYTSDTICEACLSINMLLFMDCKGWYSDNIY